MANVINVAKYALDLLGCTSTMKLQKVVFYSQAYYLVKHGSPLFEEQTEAWVNGPVVPVLFSAHKKHFVIEKGFFGSISSDALTDEDKNAIEHVVSVLKNYDGATLSKLTHSEAPWQEARKGLAPNEWSNKVITLKSIYSYYSSACNNPVFAS